MQSSPAGIGSAEYSDMTLSAQACPRTRTITLIIVALLTFGLANVVLDLGLRWAAKSGFWIGHKVSKSYLLANESSVDVVFVGSSRTLYGIDTAGMEKRGIKAFNFGVPGRYLPDFPYMVQRAIEGKPKVVVLNVPITSLSGELFWSSQTYTVMDFLTYASLGPPTDDLWKAAKITLSELFPIRRYWGRLQKHLLSNQTDQVLTAIANDREIEFSASDVVFADQNSRLKWAHLRNGDGLLWGTYDGKKKFKGASKKRQANPRAVRLLNELADKIRANGGVAVLNFEPSGSFPVDTRLITIPDALRFDYVWRTFEPFQAPGNVRNAAWVDGIHLSPSARQTYSLRLAENVSSILASSRTTHTDGVTSPAPIR